MAGYGYADALTWTLIVAGIAFLVAQPRLSLGGAITTAALTAMAAKTALLELV